MMSVRLPFSVGHGGENVPDKIAAREPGNKRAFSRLFSLDQALHACQAVARLYSISLYARISCGAHGLVSTSDLLFLLYFIFGIRTFDLG